MDLFQTSRCDSGGVWGDGIGVTIVKVTGCGFDVKETIVEVIGCSSSLVRVGWHQISSRVVNVIVLF